MQLYGSLRVQLLQLLLWGIILAPSASFWSRGSIQKLIVILHEASLQFKGKGEKYYGVCLDISMHLK